MTREFTASRMKNPLGLGGVSYALIGAMMTAGVSSAAIAQEGTPRPEGSFRATCQNLDAERASRLAYFGTKLRIGPDQKSAWERFETDTRDATEPMKQVCAKVLDARPPERLPDRMDVLVSIESAKYDALRRQSRAVADFYRTLTPEQQRIADHLKGFGGER